MKSVMKVVLIMVIGMITLNGYSSTTTHTTKKKDIIEKYVDITQAVVTPISQMVLVENQDVGSITSYTITKENTEKESQPNDAKIANRASIYRDSFHQLE